MRKFIFRIHLEIPFLLFWIVFLAFNSSGFAQIAEIVFSAPWGDAEDQIGLIDQPELEKCGPLSFCADQGGIFLLDSVRKRLLSVVPNEKFRVTAEGVAGSSLCGDGKGGAFVQNRDGIVHVGPKGEKKGAFHISMSEGGKPVKLIEGYGNEMFIDPRGGAALRTVDQKIHKIAGAKGDKPLPSSTPGVNLDLKIRRMLKNEVRIIGFDDQGKALISVKIQIDGGTAGAVLYKGMDEKGDLYAEIENVKDGRAFLEVHRYSQTGKRLAVFELSNDYFTTVYKKTEIASDGSVYQMLTTPDGVRILRYGKEG